MDDRGVFAHLVGSRYRAVSEPCAAHDDQIRVVQSAVGNGLAVGAEHSEIHLVVAGHYSDSHHRGDHGDPGFVGKRLKFQLYARGQNAAARNDDRTSAVFDRLDRAPYLSGVAAGVGLVADDIYGFGIFKTFDLVLLNIHRDVD